MIKSTYLLSAFVLVALVQLFVPAKMIYDQEKILTEGRAFKFKTAPVDPTDYFRGKYVQLRFANNTFLVSAGAGWEQGEKVYVEIVEGADGYAQIFDLHRTAPSHTADFFSTKIASINNFAANKTGNEDQLSVEFNFDRFYMEESKAQAAEDIYRAAVSRSSNEMAYALVKIKNGSSVLEDVLLNEVSLQTLVEIEQKGK